MIVCGRCGAPIPLARAGVRIYCTDRRQCEINRLRYSRRPSIRDRIAALLDHLANRIQSDERALEVQQRGNPWPALDARYAAAARAKLGDQLRPDELSERIRIELENAFATGALWQHGRGGES